jgi:hypothetical protein
MKSSLKQLNFAKSIENSQKKLNFAVQNELCTIKKISNGKMHFELYQS